MLVEAHDIDLDAHPRVDFLQDLDSDLQRGRVGHPDTDAEEQRRGEQAEDDDRAFTALQSRKNEAQDKEEQKRQAEGRAAPEHDLEKNIEARRPAEPLHFIRGKPGRRNNPFGDFRRERDNGDLTRRPSDCAAQQAVAQVYQVLHERPRRIVVVIGFAVLLDREPSDLHVVRSTGVSGVPGVSASAAPCESVGTSEGPADHSAT